MNDRAIEENGHVTRGDAPVGGVTVFRHMVYEGHLTHTLDYVVLLHLLFATAEGRSMTPLILWEELKGQGIRSAKNASELVGKNAVYEALGRLITAGYVMRVMVPNAVAGRRPSVAYRVFDNPAWNPDWQAQQVGTDPLAPLEVGSVKPQVSPLPGTPDVAFGEVIVSAGQPTSRNAGRGEEGSGVPGSGKRAVPAGQPTSGVPGSGKAAPPHPPEEEVGTTSPSPHKPAPKARRSKQEAPVVGAEAAAAAAQFLMALPGNWSVGLTRAQNLAPWLVHNAALTGWEIGVPLRMYLTRPEPGKKPIGNYGAVLGYRIKDMQSREAVVQAAEEAPEPPSETPEISGMPDWCGKCNGGELPLLPYMRTIPATDPDDDSVTRCPECHPAEAKRRTRT